MALTPCLHCGTPTTGSYCRRHGWTARRKIRSGWEWGKTRAHIHARDHTCVRCGSTRRLEVHHIVELVHGGSNELSNLELLCHHCHVRDGAGVTSR